MGASNSTPTWNRSRRSQVPEPMVLWPLSSVVVESESLVVVIVLVLSVSIVPDPIVLPPSNTARSGTSVRGAVGSLHPPKRSARAVAKRMRVCLMEVLP